MKYIKNQPTVKITSDDGEEVEFLFYKWLISAIHANQLFGKGLKNIMTGAKLVTDITDQKDSQYIALEDDEFDKLKESVEICQWVPKVAIKLVPFFQAVNNPMDKSPEDQEEK